MKQEEKDEETDSERKIFEMSDIWVHLCISGITAKTRTE